MPFSDTDHHHMTRALELAQHGLFTTQPNPLVGCVIVRDGELVGEGWHQRAGEPHAEVFALRAAGEHARGATAYVTLEPCSHHGRTPPCAEALIEAGVARVVIACTDPNPKAGGGVDQLRAAGITVETGLMQKPARELNIGFFSRMERGRPWLRVKLAMSLDGRTALANGESKWITGEAARADVQRWRARSSAIMTGAGTASADDPRLTVRWGENHPHPGPPLEGEGVAQYPSPPLEGEGVARYPSPPLEGEGVAQDSGSPPEGEGVAQVRGSPLEWEGFAPLRVVLDARLDALQPRAHLLDGSVPTLVLHAQGAQPRDDRYARVETAVVECDPQGRLDLEAVLRLLAGRGCNEVQVEAGATLCGALFVAGLVDELLVYIAPVLLGEQAQPLLRLPPLASMAGRWNLTLLEQCRVGGDLRVRLRPA